MNRSHRETCFLSFGPYIGNTRAVRHVSFIRRNLVMSSPPGYSLRARLIADHTSHAPSPCTRSCLCSRLKLAWLHASLIIDHRPPSLATPSAAPDSRSHQVISLTLVRRDKGRLLRLLTLPDSEGALSGIAGNRFYLVISPAALVKYVYSVGGSCIVDSGHTYSIYRDRFPQLRLYSNL